MGKPSPKTTTLLPFLFFNLPDNLKLLSDLPLQIKSAGTNFCLFLGSDPSPSLYIYVLWFIYAQPFGAGKSYWTTKCHVAEFACSLGGYVGISGWIHANVADNGYLPVFFQSRNVRNRSRRRTLQNAKLQNMCTNVGRSFACTLAPRRCWDQPSTATNCHQTRSFDGVVHVYAFFFFAFPFIILFSCCLFSNTPLGW